MTKHITHCSCCNCKRNLEYKNLPSVEAQIDFLNALTTLDKLRVIVNDYTFAHVDELLTATKVLDMKKLLIYLKASFALPRNIVYEPDATVKYSLQTDVKTLVNADELNFFTDVPDKHITELCQLFAEYVMFQLHMFDDYCDSKSLDTINDFTAEHDNFDALLYMFDTHAAFILENILQFDEQKIFFVNKLIKRYFIYKDEFHKYVSNDTIKTLVDFHN